VCQFLSAIVLNEGTDKEHWFFLTDKLINHTPKGEIIRKRFDGDDLKGHAAIRAYFELGELEGKDFEQTDFSNPANFPSKLSTQIKKGGFSFMPTTIGWMLSPQGKHTYAKREKAYAEWEKAYAEREKADAEWRKAYAEWEKTDAEWEKADAEWRKADAEWRKADAEWRKADARIFWKIFSQAENRSKIWK